MAGLSFEFDAAGSAIGGGNPDGTAYALSSANGYEILGYEAPEPEEEIQWASSADTEGEKRASSRPRNRTVTIRVRLAKSTDALVESEFNNLGKKIGKLRREGGTLKVTHPSGTVGYFDIQSGGHAFPWDHRLVRVKRGEITITLPCDPYIRTAEQSISLGTPISTAGGVHVWVPATGIPGDVPALGRLTLTDSASQNQWWLTWGIQSRYYSSASSALLFYQAESLTAMGGSATAAGPTGASGSGSNVMRNTALAESFVAILSTQASGGGSHLSHVGTFHAYARVQIPTTNSGTVTVAFESSEADFLRSSVGPATNLDSSYTGRWVLVDLGLVSLRKATAGTQRWEGRVLAKSSVAGDDIDVDYLFFVPVDEGSGIASAVTRDYTPSTFSARDDFTGTSSGSNLNTRTPPVGAAWATSGVATDFAFIDAGAATNDSEAVSRSAASDSRRYAVLGSDMTDVEVQARQGIEFLTFGSGFCTATGGVLARWVDANNHLRFYVNYLRATGEPGWTLQFALKKVVSSTESTLYLTDITHTTMGLDASLTLALRVSASGHITARARSSTGVLIAEFISLDSDFATGGTLDDGKAGIFDNGSSTLGTAERWYDDVIVFAPPKDAAMFASQSLELRHDRVIREDSGGTLWPRPSSYVGDYLLVPPAGQEARSLRLIAKGSRIDPFLADAASDTMTGTLNVTPRFLAMPD